MDSLSLSLLLSLAVLDLADNMQLLSRERESKEFEGSNGNGGEFKFKFPASNSLTGVDRRYFEMIRSEAEWDNSTFQEEESEPREKKSISNARIDLHGFPESFSLTETDREYFNIIKTEDGLSQFYKSVGDQGGEELDSRGSVEEDRGHQLHANFKYHVVTSSNKRIVGLYLPHQ